MATRLKDLSFLEHLDELRERLVKVVITVLVTSCAFYIKIDQILAIVIRPVGRLVFTAPTEAFLARLYLTIIGGIVLAFPVILYQIWQFVAGGLKEDERKYVKIFAPFSLICFVTGALFAYFIMVPISMRFLLSFSTDLIVPMITVQKYISFVGSLILAFGIVFELPLVLLFLTKIGIATPAFLEQKRKHAVVLVLVVSAFLTPPDVITQLMMAAPLIVLYEVGIIVSKITYRTVSTECR